ncbi:hypothetical protein FBU59_000887 [Linderina macrospora]|uniref:Uncharacterized protein n=1 Tax=Linderina macrospora TaxID=4868 RepID=A0ACC1JFK5_9FUNG|nr:hypothetical protein FBU59_000887 [Linderina macrospora]
MSRRGYSIILFVLILLQLIVSMAEFGLLVGERVYIAKYLPYTSGWMNIYKWVLSPVSFAASTILLYYSSKSLAGRTDTAGEKSIQRNSFTNRKRKRNGKSVEFFAAVISFLLAAAWSVVIAFQARYKVDAAAGNDFKYPLDTGIFLNYKCEQQPFSLKSQGITACKLMLAESATTLSCLVLWGVTLIAAVVLGLTAASRRSRSVRRMKGKMADNS